MLSFHKQRNEVIKLFNKLRCQAVIDSGTSFYSAPEEFVTELNGRLAVDRLCQNIDSLPLIEISLKESTYNKAKVSNTFNLTLQSKDYVTTEKVNISIEENNEFVSLNKCMLDFIPTVSQDQYIIFGLKFLRKYYTVFDFSKHIIGFVDYNLAEENKDIEYEGLLKRSEMGNLISDWKMVYGM